MIHLNSTLAVSALMLAGMVAASPFPYRGEEPSRPRPAALALVQPAVAAAPAATAWSDPPARAQTTAEAPKLAAVLEPEAPAAAEPVAPVVPAVVQASARPAVTQVPSQARAERERRRKVARATQRERQAAARQTPAATPEQGAQVASGAAASPAPRIDPIGDILRGLGIGREG